MEKVSIPKEEYEKMLKELNKLRQENDLLVQFKESLEDAKAGRIRRVDSADDLALLSEESLAKEWLTPEEDEAWKDL